MRNLIIILSFMFLLTSCSDEDGTNLLVTSKHNSGTVGQSMVYIVEGHNVDPQLALKDYSFSQRSDGTGQAYFKGLNEGDYTVYIYGYYNNQKVEGRQEFIVNSSTRSKTSKIDVYLN